MIVSQKDQAAVVELMVMMYLETVKPRPARDVSLEEFRAYLQVQLDPAAIGSFQAAIHYQVRKKDLLRQASEALERSIDFMTTMKALMECLTEKPKEDGDGGG
jgi:hypothetical protein